MTTIEMNYRDIVFWLEEVTDTDYYCFNYMDGYVFTSMYSDKLKAVKEMQSIINKFYQKLEKINIGK